MRHYVYIHKRNDTNEVFYVGHGSFDRATTKKRNNKTWQQIADTVGFTAEVLHDGLTKLEATEIEAEYLNKPPENWKLVNKKKSEKPLNLNDVDFSNIMVDNSCDQGLCYKTTTNGWVKAGRPLGHKRKDGYYNSRINGRLYLNHRVVYYLTYGCYDENLVVHHVDNNCSNNRPENLQLVSYQENARKTKRKVSGISVCNFNGYMYYMAYWNENFQQKQKYFSVKKLGDSEAKRLAAEYRSKMNGVK